MNKKCMLRADLRGGADGSQQPQACSGVMCMLVHDDEAHLEPEPGCSPVASPRRGRVQVGALLLYAGRILAGIRLHSPVFGL